MRSPLRRRRRVEPRRMPRRWTALMLAFLATLASPALLTAEEMLSPLLDRYTFTLGSYFTEVDSDVSADSLEGGVNDRVDFERDLRFGNSDELFRFEGQFIFKRRHQLNVAYYDLNRRAANTVTREIEWRDRVFPVNSDVEGFFNTEVSELSYTYWLVAKEKVVFGLNGGITMLGIDIGVDLVERTTRRVSADIGLDEPVPLIGFEVRTSLTKKLHFRGIGRAITVDDIGDLSRITVSDFTVGLEHRTFGKGGFGIAYRALNFDIDIEKDLPLNRVLTGTVDYGLGGFEAYLRFWFK